MSDSERRRDKAEDLAAADEDCHERLDDLEPSDDDNAGVKGGGPRDPTTMTGGRPEN